MTKRRWGYGILGGLAVVVVAGVSLLQRADPAVGLKILQKARLEEANQSEWDWNDPWVRERRRQYSVPVAFDDALSSVREELLPQGWTESQLEVAPRVYLFRKTSPQGAFVVRLDRVALRSSSRITVMGPALRATTPWVKLRSWLQGFDGRYTLRRTYY